MATQPTLFVDLAGTYVQQEKIEQACECALKAIDIAVQINSKVFLQRLQRLRDTLEPWRETKYVAEFDGSLAPFLQPKSIKGR